MDCMIKKVNCFFYICLCFCVNAFSQGIVTASDYFKSVSDYYATLKDYEASVEIVADKQEMMGIVSYKKPDLLKIEFSKPQDQVIVFNGEMLTIYLPSSSSVLQQSVQSDKANAASIASSLGLSLLRRYYVIAYEFGQEPLPLENGSNEQVVKLKLSRRNTSEAFQTIKIAINSETNLIRRIEAFTPKGETYSFNFLDYKINQDITDQRFIYDPPSSANNYNNFLFSE